jgi:hypothetical protein
MKPHAIDPALPLDLPKQRRPIRLYNAKLRAFIARVEAQTGERAPNIGDHCEKRFSGLFDVPDRVWAHYIAGQGLICLPCWNRVIQRSDGGAYARAHGEVTALWSPEFRRRHGMPADEPSPWKPPMHGHLTHSKWLDEQEAKRIKRQRYRR